LTDYIGYRIFLEQADAGDACGSGLKASGSVLESDAAQREHGDFVLAGSAKGFNASSVNEG
jgi:hypothetical protein